MASPQTENGFTKIANELLEALAKVKIGYGNRQILDVIIRKTYGFNKKKDKISIGKFQEATGLSRRMTIYCLQSLEAKRMIVIQRKRGRGNINEINGVELQKNYDLWVVQEKSKQYDKELKRRKLHYIKSKQRVVQEIGGSARNGKRVVQETVNDVRFLAPTKETITKEKNIKKVITEISYTQEFENFWKECPKKVGKKIAYTKWKKLNKKEKEEVLLAIKNYRTLVKREAREEQHIKEPSGFLNKKYEFWKDYLEIEKKPSEMTDEEFNKYQEESI